ncbi:bacillithiol system protein YtxJ [Salisediminibacterium halotolerans]|nr:bacillithiol system protein YtxJ [Actinophytocola xinjiangensis]RPE83983.1 bacillithiol system protein YtxJ [Salisediminibacterium halotolerans]TWG32466.1 bacillithiol system protein YtxJ [Salisediminibacterium halotolerans]GEL08057.1 hypothetical protein SHA02_14730 [Salisediminibacterium halotolerans]
MKMYKLIRQDDLDAMINQHSRFLLYKNSTTCPVSTEAFEEVRSYSEEDEALPVAYLHVQEAREASNYAANYFDVQHKSPQILLVENGSCSWNASHWHITADAIRSVTEK